MNCIYKGELKFNILVSMTSLRGGSESLCLVFFVDQNLEHYFFIWNIKLSCQLLRNLIFLSEWVFVPGTKRTSQVPGILLSHSVNPMDFDLANRKRS